MDAITLLLQRNSRARLTEPGPDNADLELMIRSALRAPDHGYLRPTRFLVIEGDSRNRLGELFATALRTRKPTASPEEIEKNLNAPTRAPLVVTVIARVQEHPKVPAIEQLLSSGCAAHGLLLAAHALGFGAMWRTGANSYDPIIKRGLGVAADEEIVGYVYIGTPAPPEKPVPELNPADFMQRW